MLYLVWQGGTLALFALLFLTNSAAVALAFGVWACGGWLACTYAVHGERARRTDRRSRPRRR